MYNLYIILLQLDYSDVIMLLQDNSRNCYKPRYYNLCINMHVLS